MYFPVVLLLAADRLAWSAAFIPAWRGHSPLICHARHVTWQPLIDPESKIFWRQAGNTGAVGLEIAVALVIGYFGGQHLDGKLGTSPWLTWLGFAVGIGAGIKALVRVSRQYAKDSATASSKDSANKKTPDNPA